MSRPVRLFSIVLMCLMPACSVGMAMKGTPEPNVGGLNIGQHRDIVLLNLGQPTRTTADASGRTDYFELERGNQSSAGRALGHAAMDVLTLGIWEIVGTPIEGFTGDQFVLTVQYDMNDKVTKIQTGPGHSNF